MRVAIGGPPLPAGSATVRDGKTPKAHAGPTCPDSREPLHTTAMSEKEFDIEVSAADAAPLLVKETVSKKTPLRRHLCIWVGAS